MSTAFLPRSLSIPRFDLPRIEPANLTGPFYEDGSVIVTYDYRSIPHHDPVKPDHMIVGVLEAGTYSVKWTVGAKNLARRAEGILRLEVRHEETPEPARVETLHQLLGLLRVEA